MDAKSFQSRMGKDETKPPTFSHVIQAQQQNVSIITHQYPEENDRFLYFLDQCLTIIFTSELNYFLFLLDFLCYNGVDVTSTFRLLGQCMLLWFYPLLISLS